MTSVVKVRLYPAEIQKGLIAQHFGSVRLIYNKFLNKLKTSYDYDKNYSPNKSCRQYREYLTSYDLKRMLPFYKETEELSFLKDIDSTALQNSVINLDRTFKNFFKGNGYPKFKSKYNSKQSYKTEGGQIKDNKLYLPKIGLIKAIFNREINGDIKSVTISREGNKYFASINYSSIETSNYYNNGKVVGIDVGVRVFATLSDGTVINNPNLKDEEQKMVKAQKVLSRRKKGSNNRFKAKLKLSKAHLKLRNKRDDFLHKVSYELSKNQAVVVESLKIKNMSKSAVGTVDNPNNNSKAKKGLNRSILSMAWGKFFGMLEYKLLRNGNKLIKVNPKYTSQTCSKCGHKCKENRLSQSEFICVKCSNQLNSDYNAALNILFAGFKMINAVGTTVNTEGLTSVEAY